MNKIIIHTYNFLKLFVLDHYRSKKQLPVIDQFLIVMIIKTICKADGRGVGVENFLLKTSERSIRDIS